MRYSAASRVLGSGKRTRKQKGRAKVRRVMGEWKSGSLKSRSGQPVKSRKQAVAIALSEARRATK